MRTLRSRRMRLTADGSSPIRGLTRFSATAYIPSCHSASGTRVFWYHVARPSSSQLVDRPSTLGFHGSSRWKHSWASCHLARAKSVSASGLSRITTCLDRRSAPSGAMPLSGNQSRGGLPGVLSMSIPTNANKRSRGPNQCSMSAKNRLTYSGSVIGPWLPSSRNLVAKRELMIVKGNPQTQAVPDYP